MKQTATEVTSVFRIKPQDFSPIVEVAACYIESNGKFLFLKRADGKLEGGRWGVPGGKVESGESTREAVIRETFEETGIRLTEENLKFIGKVFVRKPNVDYIYYMYHQNFSQFPVVSLNDEHQEYRWLFVEEVTNLPIMSGGVEVLHHFRALANKPDLPRKPFYFIRHGETDVNADPNIKRVDYDFPLNNKGRKQAELARTGVAGVSPKSVYYSPIQRAVETKEILIESLNMEHVEIGDLSECKAHVWAKMVKLEEGHGYHVCEDVENFLTRAIRGLSTALEEEGPILIVAHGGVHWALCYHMLIENHPWKIGNCELVHFRPVGDMGWEAEVITTD